MPGARYHVIARANRGEFILKNPSTKEMLISIVRRAKRKYRFAIETFCIMDSHVHFIIRPMKGESISRIMQWILSVFAVKYNRKFGFFGHVWLDRFKSFILFTDAQRFKAHRYISQNPVVAGIAKHHAEYQFSASRMILEGDFSLIEKPPQFIYSIYLDKSMPILEC